MSDTEEKALPPKNEPEKSTEESEASGASGFGGFGVASSWLNQGSSWGASFLNSAKEKTMTTLDLVKKDLTDLSDAVSAEVNDLASAAKEGFGSAANAVKQQAQMLEKLVTPTEEEKSINDGQEAASEQPVAWLDKIVASVTETVMFMGSEETTKGEEDFTEAINPKKDRRTCLSQLKLSEIQNNETTYLTEPADSEFYTRWLSRFNLDEYDGEINMLLANNPSLRQLFANLVPASVSHQQFWKRYFYAIEVAEMAEEMSVETNSRSPSKKSTSPSSDTSAVVVDEPTSPSQSEWSVCSEKNVEEIPSNDEDEVKGPLTPKPRDDNKEEGWVNWDE